MFKIDWATTWDFLKIEALGDRRLDPTRDRKDQAFYLTRKTRNDYMPIPLTFIEQETIGL